MRKLGLGLLVTGVLGQLSALLWTYTSTGPTCENNVDNSYIQQKVTDFEHEFDDIANKVCDRNQYKSSRRIHARIEYAQPPSRTKSHSATGVAGSA